MSAHLRFLPGAWAASTVTKKFRYRSGSAGHSVRADWGTDSSMRRARSDAPYLLALRRTGAWDVTKSPCCRTSASGTGVPPVCSKPETHGRDTRATKWLVNFPSWLAEDFSIRGAGCASKATRKELQNHETIHLQLRSRLCICLWPAWLKLGWQFRLAAVARAGSHRRLP